MLLGGIATPSPSNDPFAPDPSIWPEAPAWLFPTVMTAAAVVAAVVVVLIVMWRRAVIVERARRKAQPPTQWIDLSTLDKKGRWTEHDE